MSQRLRSMGAASLLALLAIGWLSACQSHQTFDDQKNAAKTRWQQVRSTMILEEALSRFETGDLTAAETSLIDAIKLDGANPRLYLLMGRIAIERGQLERAQNYLRTALEIDEALPDAHYYAGIVQQRWENYEAALKSYSRAYELLPDRASYLVAAAEMQIYLKQENEALESLLGKVVYFEGNAPIRVAIGQIYMIKGMPAQAAEYFERAMVLAPEDTRISEELALAQLAAGRFSYAIINIERLLALPSHSERIDLRLALASAFSATGREKDAMKIYLELSRKNPNDAEVWIRLARSSWKLDDLNGTAAAAERAIQAAPRRFEGHMLAGMVWKRGGELDKALIAFELAAQLAPEDASPAILRGMVLEQTGRPADALKAYREALRRNPDDQRTVALIRRLDTPANP